MPQSLHTTHKNFVLNPTFKYIDLMRNQKMPANPIRFAIDSRERQPTHSTFTQQESPDPLPEKGNQLFLLQVKVNLNRMSTQVLHEVTHCSCILLTGTRSKGRCISSSLKIIFISNLICIRSTLQKLPLASKCRGRCQNPFAILVQPA